MRLLVVEDEIKTGDYLQQGLTEAGFLVTLGAQWPRRPSFGDDRDL